MTPALVVLRDPFGRDVVDSGIYIVQEMRENGIALFAHHTGEFTDAFGNVIEIVLVVVVLDMHVRAPFRFLFKPLSRENGHVRARRR